ncbi:KAT8 regulatory NSL complex subunit 2 isoform X2 [Copidosoma floridanum]|uniref:KAT8 regulatory NSL complex subunit 2 isoform X2 n=1 Tax=Copidosoma floridanum TaxID=29053 RepID=UPI000C6F90EE|nr:KAT8 regulatory NSL complex subunit 2 isoform X2 [Copidosoma floridanum]
MFRVPKSTMPAPTVTSAVNTLPKQTKDQYCSYTSFECYQPCLEGYAYCARHILEDQKAPFQQCSYIYTIGPNNTRPCNNAAAKLDNRDISYCLEHTRKAQIARAKSISKHSLPETPETLLLNLSHYVKPVDAHSKKDESEEEKVKVLNPFTEIDAYRVNAKGSEILDYASSSDSDTEPTLVNDTVKGTYFDDDSDKESLNSPEEDPLKHAGLYTAEEVVCIAREKLMRLQTLYIDQFKRLQYTLREKRRKYLHNLKKEKETLCSIHDQPKTTAKEKKIYEKLKALNSYHRRSGVEAILYKKSLERRAQSAEGPAQKPPSAQKCVFTEGGVKCGERTLPSSKYCRKHILKDQNQVLFKACGAKEADMECHEPVPVIFDTNCVFHSRLPTEFKLEPLQFKEEPKEQAKSNLDMDIDAMGDSQEIDPDDDMAGIMREMNDVHKKSNFNESANSEASTDTAFSITAQMSDRDDFSSM